MKSIKSSDMLSLKINKSGSKIKALVVAAALSFVTGVSADDTELFFSNDVVPPNVILVLDNSGSMRKRDDRDANNNEIGLTRLEKVQAALELLVTSFEDVNVGLIEYSLEPELTVPIGNIGAIEGEDCNVQGGVPSQRCALLSAIDAMVAQGATATQAALWQGREYLLGRLKKTPTSQEVYPSPVEHECQENHIILMTDGNPTERLNIVDDIENAIGRSCESVQVLDSFGNSRIDPSRQCGAELAELLLNDDLNATGGANTHTIGFNFTDPWLETVSTAGEGEAYEVTSSAGLVSAIQDIFEGIDSAFAAPAVPPTSFNESRHREELYFSQFQASRSVRWNGNIKKYRLAQIIEPANPNNAIAAAGNQVTRTVIVDADDQPLLNQAGGIEPNSRSLWSTTPDGASIPEGGFAHRLPPYDQRQWYTDYNSQAPDSREPVKVTINNPATLPPGILGAADAQERDTLVSWALGRGQAGIDPLLAAAATSAETAAKAAANAARVASAQATVASTAAAAAAVQGQAVADQLRQVEKTATDALNAAIANGGNLAGLVQAADDASRDALAATVDANALNDAARVAKDDADAAQADFTVADQASLLAIGAAASANDESHHFIADSLHNTPILASYFARSGTGERGEILFSANNMGVLHAIDPVSGVELWSYTPQEHLGNIKEYFDNEDRPEHVYGLDGEFLLHTTAAVQAGFDFLVDDARLYMTERRGGNRVYGLDVTNGLKDPLNEDPFSVMWKITGGANGTPGFADLAQSWSKPQIIDVTIGCPANCQQQELLMFSGGYNADVYDDKALDYELMPVPTDSHGNAVYFVDPKNGDLVWSVGNGANHSLNLTDMNHSIPSTPIPVDSDLDGSIDLMFFVDIGGDVWRVDFDNESANLNELHIAGGKIAELSPQGQSLRFFNPLDVVISGTNFSTSYFSLVTGSGMRSSPLYQEPNLNRLYAIKDRWIQEAPFRLNARGVKESDYRYVTESPGNYSIITPDEDVVKNISDATSTTSTLHGFFRTFQPGEKILQPTRVTNNLIFSNSYVPPDVAGRSGCSYDIGLTRLYISSLLDGENAVPPGFADGPDGDYADVGSGILAGGQIIDTGKGEAPFFVIDKNVFTLKELTAPNNHDIFRRFRRTGWVELDEY